jgi:hypothetical protein
MSHVPRRGQEPSEQARASATGAIQGPFTEFALTGAVIDGIIDGECRAKRLALLLLLLLRPQ